MHRNRRRIEPLTASNDTDPREAAGADVIDLATRNVLPAVTQRRPRSEGLGLAAGVAVVGLLGALTLWSMDAARQSRAAPPAAQNQDQRAAALASPETIPAVPAQAITLRGKPVVLPQATTQPQGLPAPAANPLGAPTVVFDASAMPAPQTSLTGPAITAAPASQGGTQNDEFASRLGGVGGSAAVATAGINPKTTVTQGTLIPAVLETAIDTDVPGYVRALVSSDVRSFDGTRLLVPRSSRLIGQYKSGMQAGQKRAYVIWTRLIRPDGVSVNIASPAIGFGGETGLAGKVDTHFFERFGSAMLLSVIGGLSTIGSGGTALIIGGQTQSAAAAAVGQTGQIGPTVRIRQGEPVRVFTARDLDFSRVSAQ